MDLYIASEGEQGPIKIGRSVSAPTRLASLQTGNPRPLRFVAVYRLASDQAIEAERILHDELKRFAMVGEWFDLDEQFIRNYMPDFFLSVGFEVQA